MPLPAWLNTLAKSARLFYPIAQRGVSEGLSGNAILTAYRSGGGTIRRQTALDVIRNVRGVERRASVFASLRKDLLPSVSRIPSALTKTLRDFSYLLRFQGVTETGKTIQGHVTVSTMDLMTREQAEQTALQYLDDMPESYGIESIESVQLESIKKSPFLS